MDPKFEPSQASSDGKRRCLLITVSVHIALRLQRTTIVSTKAKMASLVVISSENSEVSIVS